MNAGADSRLAQLLQLVDREDRQLEGVRRRIFADGCELTVQQVEALVHTDIGIDRLESFGAKFARMQDTMVDKLMPELLREAGEKVLAAIDNLTKLEQLGLVASADQWLAMRGLRNRLVHEYIDSPEHLGLAMERACHFSLQMHLDYNAIRLYAKNRLGVDVCFSATDEA